MDKYKVLLVDDEEEAIEAIRLKLEWETLGFEVIGSANNGVKALELVERLQPDVVITDIKMPYMDGLELARALNRTIRIFILLFLPDLMNLNMPKKPFIWRLKSICSSRSIPRNCRSA